MIRNSRAAALVAVAFTLFLALASPAFAETPARWSSLDLSVHYEDPDTLLLVSGALPEGTKLPATVEMAVPTGAKPYWAGELLGGDPKDDPTATYTVATRGNMDVYTFKLTKSLRGQLEVTIPQATVFDGSTYAAAFSWVAPSDVPSASINFRIPQAAQLTTTAPGAQLTEGETGYRYYTKSVSGLKAGEPLELAFAYTLPAAVPAPAAAQSGSVIPWLLFAAFGIAVFFVVRAIVRRARGLDGAEEEVVPAKSAGTAKPRNAASAKAVSVAVEDEAQAAPRGGSSKLAVVTVAVLVAVIAGFWAVSYASAPKATGGSVTREIAQGEACTSATVALNLPQGAAANQAAEKAIDAVAKVPSVTKATVSLQTGAIEVAFCESSANEEAIRSALAPTGLLAQ